MKEFMLVGTGGFLGANLRYLVNTVALRYIGPSLPWGTLLVNVTGSFVLGAFLVWTTERVLADPAYRFAFAIGFCGAYTTFSSFAFETVRLFEQGHHGVALANFLVNNLLALGATAAGVALARAI